LAAPLAPAMISALSVLSAPASSSRQFVAEADFSVSSLVVAPFHPPRS
jgi:hypothetical protein